MGVTGRDGTFRIELPIGKAVVALSRHAYEEVWIGLDQETEVLFEC
jgi:hypothetical protein